MGTDFVPGPQATLLLNGAGHPANQAGRATQAAHSCSGGESRHVMRREWGWRKWGRRKWEETSCPAAGTASLAGVGHMELPPPVFQTQAKGPTVLTNSLQGEGGAAELGGEQPEETGQQEESGREQQLGRKLQWAGGVWGGRHSLSHQASWYPPPPQ